MKALQSVLSPKKVISADVGQISREGKSRRFIVSAGMGFDAGVCHEVCVSQWKKRLNKIGLGKLSYAVVALDRLKKDRPTKLTVTLPDGRKQMFEKTLFVAFMNLPYEGGGFRFAPEASVTDGCIDIVIAHHMSPLKAVWLLRERFLGNIREQKKLRSFGVLRYRLRRSEASDPYRRRGGVFPDIRHRWRYWKKNCISLQDNSRKI